MLCLIVVAQLFSCTESVTTLKLDELVGEIYENAAEPAETSDGTILTPGTRTPVGLLKIADDTTYVGKKVSLDIKENGDNIVYAYFGKTSESEEKLVVIYNVAKSSDSNGDSALVRNIAVTLKTEYGSCTELCAQKEFFTGTVESIDIVGYFDYQYPLASFGNANDCSAPNADSTSCYGVIYGNSSEKADVCYDGVQFEAKGHADPFKQTLERFGIK
jgi:hypothetical protein